MPDHIHMLLSVPPKYSVAMTIGYLKGKSAMRIHRELLKTKGTLFGRAFLGTRILCEYRAVWMKTRSDGTSKTRRNTSMTRTAVS